MQPFRAVRYSRAAGSLADLVAPPYDAVSPEARAELFTRSPYNVVHLTLPDSAREAGELYRSWLTEGILEPEPAPAAWQIVEEYVGPDGVARERRGMVVSLAIEPYEAASVLPHERTHPRIREERLRLLRETGVHLEPIFLLADEELDLPAPAGEPDVEVDGARLWRVPEVGIGARSLAAPLLIADGHHRYESALEYAAEAGAGAPRIMALVVSTADPGLRVFPTHRTFSGRPDLRDAPEGEPYPDLETALVSLGDEPFSRAAAIAYRPDRVELVRGEERELDVELVDRHGLEGIGYTPVVADAVATVDRGDSDIAYLVRGPRVGDVFAAARRGERMPPKSTFFYPKPLSGLLFHPVEPL